MLANYGYVALFFLVALFFGVFILVFSRLLSFFRIRPRKPDPIKSSTYECGMKTIGSSWIQFNFRYYFFALLFVIFDIEVVFLYPWAVHFKKLGLFGLVEMLIFILILVIGYVYAWKKRVLEWK